MLEEESAVIEAMVGDIVGIAAVVVALRTDSSPISVHALAGWKNATRGAWNEVAV